MASIHPHGTGFRVHFTRDGRKEKSGTLPTEEAARAWIAERMPAVQDDSTLSLIDLWRADVPGDYREDVAERLERLIRTRGWTRPEKLTASDLKTWVREDPHWRRPCQYLRTVLRWAANEHRIPIRPEVLLWRPPRKSRKAKPAMLTDTQAALIRDQAASLGPRSFAIIDYLMTYGARPITACRLRLTAIDERHSELVLGQRDATTGREGEKHSGGWRHRLYKRHLDAWPALWWDGEPAEVPIFPHYVENRPWRIDRGRASELASFYVNRIGRPLKDKLGALTGIYHLKRYAITRLFRAKIDPGTIALFTGHLDQAQLMTYAVSNSDLQDDALARLDELAKMAGSQAGSQVPKRSSQVVN